ncbi:hypothetical protein CYY_007271 [Polysphondylium violaceum]|uniref:Uncharacterized protein n=1 Tax=Polysphondylium violaceum TaxID=133409 RepID=A0A8J4PQP2_9MYCE|nr:hypothetical protein CYY_007271 [Polysphondylium violaceum]
MTISKNIILDYIKVAIPSAWGIACLITFVYTFDDNFNALLLVSGIAGFLFSADIWYNYRSSDSTGYSRLNATTPPNPLFVNLKLFICIVLILMSAIMLIFYFDWNRKADVTWGVFNFIFGMIWGTLTIKYQKYNENHDHKSQAQIVPLSSDIETLEV